MRTVADVVAVCDGLGIPVTHMQWWPKKAPKLPYAVLVPHKSRNRYGDNVVLEERIRYDLELYASERDVPLEKRVQAALNGAGIAWSRDHFTDPDGPTVCAVYSMTLTEQEADSG